MALSNNGLANAKCPYDAVWKGVVIILFEKACSIQLPDLQPGKFRSLLHAIGRNSIKAWLERNWLSYLSLHRNNMIAELAQECQTRGYNIGVGQYRCSKPKPVCHFHASCCRPNYAKHQHNIIEQKFLEPGHTHMEVDSMHPTLTERT